MENKQKNETITIFCNGINLGWVSPQSRRDRSLLHCHWGSSSHCFDYLQMLEVPVIVLTTYKCSRATRLRESKLLKLSHHPRRESERIRLRGRLVAKTCSISRKRNEIPHRHADGVSVFSSTAIHFEPTQEKTYRRPSRNASAAWHPVAPHCSRGVHPLTDNWKYQLTLDRRRQRAGDAIFGRLYGIPFVFRYGRDVSGRRCRLGPGTVPPMGDLRFAIPVTIARWRR